MSIFPYRMEAGICLFANKMLLALTPPQSVMLVPRFPQRPVKKRRSFPLYCSAE